MALVKARIQNLESREWFTCLFNPTEYTIQKQNTWTPKSSSGKDVPSYAFSGGGSQVLNVQLFFDASEDPKGEIKTALDALWKLAMIDSSTSLAKTTRGRPPRCSFTWGKNWSCNAVIESINVHYTLFREDGTPIRATADLSLREVRDISSDQPQNPTSFVPKPGFKCYTVAPRDTLATIAYQAYGDATKWRVLAEANDIVDPEEIRPGDLIGIPPLY